MNVWKLLQIQLKIWIYRELNVAPNTLLRTILDVEYFALLRILDQFILPILDLCPKMAAYASITSLSIICCVTDFVI